MYPWRHVVRLTKCWMICAKRSIVCGVCSLIWKLSNLKCLGIWVKYANELKMNKSPWKWFNSTKFMGCSLCSKNFTTSRDWAGMSGTGSHVIREGVYCSDCEVRLWTRENRIPALILPSFMTLSD